MKRISIIAFLTLGLFLLKPATAQTPSAKEVEEMSTLISEVQAQQKEIAENQVKIDEKLVTLSETIREAKIFFQPCRSLIMNSKLFAALCAAVASLTLEMAYAQSPTPIVVSATAQTVAVPASATTNSDSLQATMKTLREMKAANEQILKKQQSTLEALDELQKTADQIKIFSKRG